ncbi:CheR family methyltransferase [Paenibacillus agricola]|uniref:Protein-glutamate O-methyltransferase CheR n=1 Tax=Paenibacillus agricola TaxID=2716264 RepID=A0ABX0JER6_9BACL|nr:protein-glutamate O-methyltransferase CheR [Paenibacillus agricola]NHN34038.1 protein-glutamate O-methyltransferase CheR [Paenibacillus agricola]
MEETELERAEVPFHYELPQEAVSLILSEIYTTTGYNFQDYAMATIQRRLQRRLITERMANAAELIDRLQKFPQYAYKLVADFSINVTAMFRDPQFFNYFRNEVIPELRKESFIRVWVAGCATGEEAYSLSILLQEEGLYERCRIYATDMNEGVIAQAKTGALPLSKMQAYTRNYFASGGKEQFHSYFSSKDEQVYLHAKLLRNIVFSHHNLVDDRSFNEFHVIFCRNVLIYFNHRLQEHVHDLLYDSLGLGGFLALGSRESLRFTKHASQFINMSSLQKIYKRIN